MEILNRLTIVTMVLGLFSLTGYLVYINSNQTTVAYVFFFGALLVGIISAIILDRE